MIFRGTFRGEFVIFADSEEEALEMVDEHIENDSYTLICNDITEVEEEKPDNTDWILEERRCGFF